jgi:hypothetical protein
VPNASSAAVTERDPNGEREPPFWTSLDSELITTGSIRIWVICVASARLHHDLIEEAEINS